MTAATGRRIAAASIVLVAVLSAVVDFPQTAQRGAGWLLRTTGLGLPGVPQVPFRLGLDLQGGTHLIYRADVSSIPAGEEGGAMDGVRDVIERRVNALGVAEPLVQATRSDNDWRLIVELAGVYDTQAAIKLIGETPLLEFKEANPNPTTTPTLTPEEREQLEAYNQSARVRAEDLLSQARKPGSDFAELAKANSMDQDTAAAGGELGWRTRETMPLALVKPCFDTLRDGEVGSSLVTSERGQHVVKRRAVRGSGAAAEVNCAHLLVAVLTERDVHPPEQWQYTGLTGKQLKSARVSFDPQFGEPEVALEFNGDGAKLFGDITTRNVGKPVAIFLDGTPISTPVVNGAITTGSAIITGDFTLPEARQLAGRLNAGALPVPITLLSQQTIGATLGSTAVERSLRASILSLILIAVFMLLAYRLPGLVANLSLVFYGLVLLAVFKLIPVTLTLAGIAGFILSLGMAVDANILVAERLREELAAGRGLREAIATAFARAWPSIRDGNVSTIITSLILMWFSTSIVKGFAITLILGILVSVVSAILVSRVLLEFASRWLRARWWYGVPSNAAQSAPPPKP
ncbi:MAG: protein translocase subunit SecD [Candidatus Kerfeldbacteria bacterium]|nr:protein translocase subunit SecD [Candidatus Kerfeldbacteria bacterium]